MGRQEYDAFGPWIYEIDEEHEIPRLFLERYNEQSEPLLLFKVPRRIERRNASPNMDLYDCLVGAFDTYICILKRMGKNVAEKRIYYSDIFAVKDMHSLLKGELMLYAGSEVVTLNYNTVSEEIVLKLINIIEQRISSTARIIDIEGLPIEYDPHDGEALDMLFYNLINNKKIADAGIKLAAYQKRIYAKRTAALKEKLKSTVLSRCAFLINDRVLIVLMRETPKRNKRKEDPDYSFMYVPLCNIRGAASYCFDEQQGLSVLELGLMHQTFSFIFESVNTRISNLCGKLNGW